MDDSTRPSRRRRQVRAISGPALAVILLAIVQTTATWSSPSADPFEVDTTQSLSTDTAHEVSLSMVPRGEESILLAARLTASSLHVARDVAWQVRNADGELVLDATANELSSPLPPGEYVVEAQYGAVALRETVRLVEGNSIAVNFILNAGGLRVLPMVKNMQVPGLQTRTLIYALSGPDNGKLITHSDIPGELMKLPVGAYRVESRVGVGNAVAVTDVRVRPGKLSALEISHNAGVAKLNFVGAPDASVVWDVRPIDGVKIDSYKGLSQQLTLKPGTYLAEAHVNGEILTAKFRINAGEEREIMLGN